MRKGTKYSEQNGMLIRKKINKSCFLLSLATDLTETVRMTFSAENPEAVSKYEKQQQQQIDKVKNELINWITLLPRELSKLDQVIA